jgi:hypothetical protein
MWVSSSPVMILPSRKRNSAITWTSAARPSIVSRFTTWFENNTSSSYASVLNSKVKTFYGKLVDADVLAELVEIQRLSIHSLQVFWAEILGDERVVDISLRDESNTVTRSNRFR